MNITEYEQFLTREITDFRKTEVFGQEKNLMRVFFTGQAAADALTVARAVLRTSLIPEAVESGDVLITKIAQKTNNRLTKKENPVT